MTRSSPQELAAKFGADVTAQAFEEAKRERAKDHVAFAQSWLEERYGQGQPGKKRKVHCDGCSCSRWIDDMAVLGNEALCGGCMPEIPWARKSEVIYTLSGVAQAELTPTARKVAAYEEAS